MTANGKSRIRVLIVDDESLAREGIRMLLAGDADIASIDEARNGKQALRTILADKPDLVFLDVQMPEMDGFTVLRKAGLANPPVVVFVTAYDKYAIEAFEVQAVDYLLKPFTEKRFRKALDRAKERIGSAETLLDPKLLAVLEQISRGPEYLTRLALKSGGKTFFLDIASVDWIGAAENYVQLHVGRHQHLMQVTMDRVAKRLDPSIFVRVHRSFIVNVKRIREVKPAFHGEYTLVLDNGVQLRSSRTYSETMKRLISNPL